MTNPSNLISLLYISLLVSCLSISLNAEHKEGEIIIRFNDNTTEVEKNQAVVEFKLKKIKSFSLTNSVLYAVDANRSMGDLKKALEELHCVKYVSYNNIYRKQSYDPLFGLQWYLDNSGQLVQYFPGIPGVDIGWKDAMARYSPKKNTYVAVLDSGFAEDHPELKNKEVYLVPEKDGKPNHDDDGNGYKDDIYGWDFIGKDPSPYDFKGHGTQVSSIIAGNKDGVGIQGISQDAFVRSLRVLDRDGYGDAAAIIEALEYVNAMGGLRIINLSLGGFNYNRVLEETIKSFEKRDQVLIVCAAGNGGDDRKGDDNDQIQHFPSSYESSSIISVASINSRGDLSTFSNYGRDSVDIAAPGERIAVATIKRDQTKIQNADGTFWREEFFWSDSSQKWGRNKYGSTFWLESPRNFTLNWTDIKTPFFDLSEAKDPRLEIDLDFSLNFGGQVFMHASHDLRSWKKIRTFTRYSSQGQNKLNIDISEWSGKKTVVFKFSFFPESQLEYFDIGTMKVLDVQVSSGFGQPHYEFQNGTSFSAPVVSGIAALIMSHRPDLLASDVKKILLDSVLKSESLAGKVKSGGIVRADQALEKADTYKRRASVSFGASGMLTISDDFTVTSYDFLRKRKVNAGTLKGAGHYFEGDKVTLNAYPSAGYVFHGWYLSERGRISDKESYTFTIGFEPTLHYNFQPVFLADMSDNDSDQLSNYEEFLYGSDKNNSNSDGDALDDYEELRVIEHATQLSLTADDSSTIEALESVLGAKRYEDGKSEGYTQGRDAVVRSPSDHGLRTVTEVNSAKQSGIDAVLSNPSSYDLVRKAEFFDILNNQESNATPYTPDWFFLPERGWMWTQPSSYPYFYDGSTNSWLYFKSGHEKPRFYDYGKKEWITIE